MKKLMKNLLKRVLPLALTLTLLLSSSGCMAAYLVSEAVDPSAMLFGEPKRPAASSAAVAGGMDLKEPAVSQFREGMHLSDLKYTQPDRETIYKAIDDLNALLDAGETDAVRLVSDYEHILDLFDEIETASCAAYFYHAADVTDSYYENEYNDLTSVEYEVDVPLTALTIRLYESPVTEELMNSSYSEKYKEVCYLGLELNSEAVQPDIRRESDLVSRYDELLSTFTFEDKGKTWSLDDILAVSDEDEYPRLLAAYYAALNKAACDLFDELLKVRTAIATELGHASYTDYAYKSMLRSYTPEDVRPLYAAVKKHIVPLYCNTALHFYLDGISDVADSFKVDRELFLKQLRTVLGTKYPDALESLDQMLACGLWYCEPGDTRMHSEFTLTFPSYKSSCVCTFWKGNPDSATTFIHELGHYTRGYLTAGAHSWSSTAQLDLDEVDSQGLQFLMIPDYETFFGDASDAVVTSSMLDALYAIIVGCMEDEFQQAIYADPGMTNDERNALYERLTDEYGFKDLFGYTGTEWASIPHTFQSPLYYISYAVSVIPALELVCLAKDDPVKAGTIYAELLHRGLDADFRETITGLGLADPLSPDTIKSLSKALKDLI